MVIGSKELIRDMNSKLVLETILTAGSISRAAISKQLGLTKATISAIVQDLINDKLVIEIGSDDTILGRKPILISFNKKAGYAICLDINISMLSALATDLVGESRILKQIKTPCETDMINSMIDLINSMKSDLPPTPYGLVGITVAIHGITSDNKIEFTPYYDLSHIDIAEELSNYFNVPVYLENEANLSVFGEKTYLPNIYKNMANISIHNGVGLGLILDHKLYKGVNGAAGEFGHTIIKIDGLPCPCGNRGCLEQYSSERALLAHYRKMTGNENATFHTFASDYENNLPQAQALSRLFVKYLSVCVTNLYNFFAPDIVIINSSFTIEFPELLDEIHASLSDKIRDKIELAPSTLKQSSILLGGICLTVKNFLSLDRLTFHLESPEY